MSLFPSIDSAVRFLIDAEPVPQPRQRHAVGKHGKMAGVVMNYIPKNHPIWVFKDVCRLRAKQAYQGKPLEGPLRVHLLFLLPRPGRLIWKTRLMPRAWAPGRPDIDNFEKAVLDALSGHLWADDSQIVDLHSMKMYSSGDEEPGVEVMVEELQ